MSSNSVTVVPGDAVFPTITAALDSIVDATEGNQYELWVSAGTFDEQVTLKPFVTVRGAGPDQTTITNETTEQNGRSGTVNAAPNSAIESASIVSTGTTWGTWAIAVYAADAAPFAVTNCAISSNPDGAQGVNPTACAIDMQSFGGRSDVQLSYCTLQSSNFGLSAAGGSQVSASDCTIEAEGGDQTWGAFTAESATMELVYCKVIGKDFALNVDSSGSSITAINCTLDGPLAGNPTIVDDPPPSG